MIKIIEFYSPTCVPCNVVDKKIKDYISKNPNIEYERINAVDHPEYGIMGTPHLRLLKDNEIVMEGHYVNPNPIFNKIQEIQD